MGFTLLQKDRYFLLLIVAAHLLWFLAGQRWGNFYNGDSYEYIYLAENIGHGHYYAAHPLLPVNVYKLTIRPPVYPLFLYGIYSIAGHHTVIILLLQNLCSILSVYLVRNCFRRLVPGTRAGWLYLLLVIAYPAQLFFTDMIVPDILFQLFLVLYFTDAVSFLKQPARSKGWKMALWLVLAVLTKPVVYPLLYLHFGFQLYYAFRQKRWWLAMAAIIPVGVILGYAAWNAARTGLFHVSSVQSINMLSWNAAGFLRTRHTEAEVNALMKVHYDSLEKRESLKEKYEYSSAAAYNIIRQDIPAYAVYHIKASLRFFIDPAKSEMDLFHKGLYSLTRYQPLNFRESIKKYGLRGGWEYLGHYPLLPVLLLTLLFNGIRIAGFILFLFRKDIALAIRAGTLLFVMYFALISGPVANGRYFLAVLLIMSGAAALGYENVYRQLKTRRRSRSSTVLHES